MAKYVWKDVLLDEIRATREKLEMLEAMLERGKLLANSQEKKEAKK